MEANANSKKNLIPAKITLIFIIIIFRLPSLCALPRQSMPRTRLKLPTRWPRKRADSSSRGTTSPSTSSPWSSPRSSCSESVSYKDREREKSHFPNSADVCKYFWHISFFAMQSIVRESVCELLFCWEKKDLRQYSCEGWETKEVK